MRFAHSQGSDPASDTSGSWKSLPTPGQVRVLLFLSQKRQTATATCDPWGDPKIMSAHKKTPLMQPTSGTVSYINPTNIGSRKHAVFATHCRSARPLQQRAGSKYFSDSC